MKTNSTKCPALTLRDINHGGIGVVIRELHDSVTIANKMLNTHVTINCKQNEK